MLREIFKAEESYIQVNLGGKIGWADQTDNGVLLNGEQLEELNRRRRGLSAFEVRKLSDGMFEVSLSPDLQQGKINITGF